MWCLARAALLRGSPPRVPLRASPRGGVCALRLACLPWSRRACPPPARRLNAITDPLARKIIELHRECGSGTGECDSGDGFDPEDRQPYWGCETTALVASHFNIEFPPGDS